MVSNCEALFKSCYIGAYCTVLRHFNIEVSEEYLFGISQSLSFEYTYVRNQKRFKEYLSDADYISIVGADNIPYQFFLDHYGVNLIHKHFDRQDCVDTVIESLEKQEIVLAYLDVYYLKYHPQYKILHALTNVIVEKCDKKNDEFLICDNYVTTIPVSRYHGGIKFEDFINAVSITDQNINNGDYGIVVCRKDSKGNPKELVTATRENILRILDASNGNKGIHAIASLAEQICYWPDIWSSTSMQQMLKMLYLHLKGRSGLVVSRTIFAKYLAILSASRNEVATVSDDFTEIIRMWTQITNRCFRNSVTFKYNFLEELKVLFLEVMYKEINTYQQLITMI